MGVSVIVDQVSSACSLVGVEEVALHGPAYQLLKTLLEVSCTARRAARYGGVAGGTKVALSRRICHHVAEEVPVAGAGIAKYRQIALDLAARIARGEFKPGTSLPSQALLSREYGVTLMTLRQALGVLEHDGLIAQLPGRGTYVTPVPTLDLRSLNSLAEDLQQQGVELVTVVVSSRQRALPAGVAASLDRARGEPALRLERLRRIGRRVAVHQVSWVPPPWSQALSDVDFEAASLYRSLEQHSQLAIVRATETLRARALPAAIAAAVGKPAGRPVLVAERVTYDARNLPLVHDLATIVDDSISVLAQRAHRGTELSWAAANG
jgi:GntR family transcriptional regulator